jgi:ankyrin repeat protein
MHSARYAPAVALLLAAGAAVDQAKADGVTALMLAAEIGYAVVMVALLAAWAEVERAKGGWRDGADVRCCSDEWPHCRVVAALLAAVAQRWTRPIIRGVTALIYAANGGHAAVLLLLWRAEQMWALLTARFGESALEGCSTLSS